jgi:hypothetical protein
MGEIDDRGEQSHDWLRRTAKPAKLPRSDRQIGRLERLEAQISARSIQIAFLTQECDPDGNTVTGEEALVLAFDALLDREQDLVHKAEIAYRYAYDVRQARIKLAIIVGLASAALTAAIVTLGFVAGLL